VANAVKFTERGQVGLRIAAAPLPRGKLRLSFAVSDSGIGMSDAEIGRLFRPFAQANKEIAQRFGGSGLGLVQVRRSPAPCTATSRSRARPAAVASVIPPGIDRQPVPAEDAWERLRRRLPLVW
jgi:hypothetical protein